MLLSIIISKLRNGEFITFGSDFHTIGSKYFATVPGLQAEMLLFTNAFKPMDIVYALEKGSPLSIKIEETDERRDDAITGIRLAADGYSHHFDLNYKAGADLIFRAINKYGSNIAKQNYMQETASINSLVADFEVAGPLKDAITLFGFTAWVAELKAANILFIELFLQRNEQLSQKPAEDLKTLRVAAKAAHDSFLLFLTASEKLNPSADLAKLVGEINSLLEKYNTLIAGRAVKKGKVAEPE